MSREKNSAKATTLHQFAGTACSGIATKAKLAEEIKKILATGIDVNTRDADGKTALHLAAAQPENASIIEALLRLKADVNAQDKDGNTPIHLVPSDSTDTDNFCVLVRANPDLALKNKVGVSVLDCINKSAYVTDGGMYKGNIIELITDLLARPLSTRPQPNFTWTPHTIIDNTEPSVALKCIGSVVVPNCTGKHIRHLGGNLIALAGGKNDDGIAIFDTNKGSVLWSLDECDTFPHHTHVLTYDDTSKVIYVARKFGIDYYVTAHALETGKELWKTQVFKEKSGIFSALIRTSTHLVYTDLNKNVFMPIDPKSGKLLKKFKSTRKATYFDSNSLFACNEGFVVFAQGRMALDYCDPKDGTAKEVAQWPATDPARRWVFKGDVAYVLTQNGALQKLSLPDRKQLAVSHALPAGTTGGDALWLVENAGKLHFCMKLKKEVSLHTYDMAADKITEAHMIEGPYQSTTFPIAHSHVCGYTMGWNLLKRQFCLYDFKKNTRIAEAELPTLGGFDDINATAMIGGSLYVAQTGGNTFGNENCILHRFA